MVRGLRMAVVGLTASLAGQRLPARTPVEHKGCQSMSELVYKKTLGDCGRPLRRDPGSFREQGWVVKDTNSVCEMLCESVPLQVQQQQDQLKQLRAVPWQHVL